MKLGEECILEISVLIQFENCYHSVKMLKIRIHKTIILSLVLFGCETWSLLLSEDHKLQVFENKLLKNTFGPKKNGVREVSNMGEYILWNIVIAISYNRVDEIDSLRIRPLARSRSRCEDNIKLEL
jgi:hypothetical protein